MGNGFMSRPSSADSAWGKVEETKDEELYQPIRNYYGEVVGWRERTESEKLRRREINAEFAMIESEEDEVEDDEEESPSPPPPPPKKPLKVVIKEPSDTEEEKEEEENPFNQSSDRTPSAKSVLVSPAAAPHNSRVKDKFRPSLLPAENFNKDTAAGRLYRALHGETRTDVAAVIEILTQHSADQRKKISKSYKFNHNKVTVVVMMEVMILVLMTEMGVVVVVVMWSGVVVVVAVVVMVVVWCGVWCEIIRNLIH